MNFTKHKFNIYPEMDSDEYQSLKDDIQKNGYREDLPIIIYNGGIIDGWNRYRACKELGVTPKVKMFRGNDQEAIQYIMSSNKRRNLTSSQRAAIAVEAEDIIKAIEEQVEAERRAKISERENVGNRFTGKVETAELIPPSLGRNSEKKAKSEARTKIAETFGTNPRYISDAKRLKEENPEAFEKIKKGETTITKVKKEEKKERFNERKEAFEKPATESNVEASCYVGSCIDFLKDFGEKIDLVVSDPPYAMDYKSGWNDWDKISGDKREDTIPLLDEAFSLLSNKMKDDAHIYIFGNPNEVENVKPIFEKYFILKNILIWDRGVIGMGDLKTYGRSYDVIYFGYKSKWKDLNGVRDRDILTFNRVSPGELLHPTEKPLDILEYLIKKSSKENDIVVDPFAGSCSTLKAAYKLGRNSYGSELESKYVPSWM